VKINGVDVFHPNTGEVRSDGAEGIACWFIDTDYNEAWATLRSDTSRPFDKPSSGRIAVKVINHLGDEVMKVFRVA
jgi:adenine-specific DNA-methyltransferase